MQSLDLSNKQAYRDWLIFCIKYCCGEIDDRQMAVSQEINKFFYARSRLQDLKSARIYSPVKSGSKEFWINSFIKLSAKTRFKLVVDFPSMIIVLPSDCKTLRIERTQAVDTRNHRFGGKMVHYEVYALTEVLKLL